jgi:hypothetical protein
MTITERKRPNKVTSTAKISLKVSGVPLAITLNELDNTTPISLRFVIRKG